jgi:hypothetical protein
MKVQPKGTATIVKRGRPTEIDETIESALRLLKKTTEEIPLTHIKVNPLDYATKQRYIMRIRKVANRLDKPVSINWTVGKKSSPVVSIANR